MTNDSFDFIPFVNADSYIKGIFCLRCDMIWIKKIREVYLLKQQKQQVSFEKDEYELSSI